MADERPILRRKGPLRSVPIWLRVLVPPLVLILIACGVYYFRVQHSGTRLDTFAQCLTAKQVKMYGLYWCTHCAEQKELFGPSFKYVTYVECGIRGSHAEQPECIQIGAKNFPTWQFPDGQKLEGRQPLQIISTKSGCALP